MSDLIAIPGTRGEVNSHAIFFHGLGGHPHSTWQSSIDRDVCWLQWLAEDVEGLAVWTIGYDAAVSRWRGSAMHLTDRATNLLERILLEPTLQTGEIILVGHSLGGLLIKQLLRTADSLTRHREDAASFIRRVRRVGFLATPHQGSGLATLGDRLRILLRPSVATACLVRNDANLRDLNFWYRDWCVASGVAHLILTETRPLSILGLIVKPDSGDPGLLSRPISIDADHISICKPRDRDSEMYVHIRGFVTRPLDRALGDTLMEAVKENSSQLRALLDSTQEGYSRLKKNITDQGEKTAEILADRLKKEFSQISSVSLKYPREIVDGEIQKHLSIMRRARFFAEFFRSEHSLRLAEKILNGELEGGSDVIKSKALAWCSRVIALVDNCDKSDEFLRRAKELGDCPEISIAEAFRVYAAGDLEGALNMLSDINSTSSHSAAFLIVANHKDAAAAVEWFSSVGFQMSDLDPDGKYVLIAKLLELRRWDTALEYVNALHEDDFGQAPVLFFTAAIANLVQTIPDELRPTLLQQVPFEAHIFPLASDSASISYRRKAQSLFEESAVAARELGCKGVANLAEDFALWLELRDPERHGSALEKLQLSMRASEHSLRRLHFALQFGLKLDLNAVEQEIERRTVLSAGKSRDAAVARFSLAFVQKSPKDVADYIDKHRAQLEEHLGKKSIVLLEIEMLTRAGLAQRANERLLTLDEEGLSEAERSHLHKIIAQATVSDPIEARKTQFERTGQLGDLLNLVRLLEEQSDWLQLCHYGSLMFERTKDLSDIERLARALNEAGRHGELATLLRRYPEFLEQSDNLQTLWSWLLYREGLLAESAASLKKLQSKRDHPADRSLAISLSIASGEWEALLQFIEVEWRNREARETDALMRTARLAQVVGSPRAKDLVYYTVEKDPDNVHALVAAYSLATKAGWEDNETVAEWLHKAAALSDEKGPIKKVSIRDILDRAPEWNRLEEDTWREVSRGNLPLEAAARVLHQTLVDIFLLPAIANPLEQDIRRRALVPAYSGVRQSLSCNSRVVAIAPPALLTLGALRLLEPAFDLFERVSIPHSTLSWLFEEKEKVSFHQPSRIRDASRLSEFLAKRALKPFSRTAKVNPDLAADVGEELASLIAEVSSGEGSNDRHRLIVRPAPVHRVGSLMDEEADLSPYYSQLCSCSSVVRKLKEKGQLTATEEGRALSYLSLHERGWPNEPELSDGAMLFLPDISVSYLQRTGVLEKLQAAGLEAYVSDKMIDDVNALLRYEQLTSKATEIIESIRAFLAAGIKAGKVKLGQLTIVEEGEESDIRANQTLGVFDLAQEAECFIIDDRSVNRYANFVSGSKQIPIFSTFDLLDTLHLSGRIDFNQLLDYRTELRRAGYLFVPVTSDELDCHLSLTSVVDGRIVETAELRAIRENLLRIRMSRFLQLPLEASWLTGAFETLRNSLKAQWRSDVNVETSTARSEWLLELLDGRGWAHSLGAAGGVGIARYGYANQVLLLLTAVPHIGPDVKEKYLQWVDERVLARIKDEDPECYSWIIERTKELIAQIADAAVSQE